MDIARIVRTHITTSELSPPQELVNGVNDGSTHLLGIVKALGEYLTSTKDDVRLKGLTFLTNLLKLLAGSRINRQATQTLTRFYTSKLDDFDSLPPTLEALVVLSKLPTFDDEAAVEVYQAVVENVNMKAYVQATRHLVYVLFDSLLATHRNALKMMGPVFLNSYTKMVDGEKDPRNLLMLFAMGRVILLEFDVEALIEEFFDITFCYFPIAFRPPPNDPYGISSDDLKVALRGCMSATPHFARMAIPLFLEKFATATGQSMKDLMLSMAVCFPVYGAEAVGDRGTELWEGIKTEIFYSSDTTIEAAALSTLESLVTTIYPTDSDAPTGLAQDIIKQCSDILQQPEKAQGIAATKALAALIRASPSVGKYGLSQTLPQLFRQFNRPALASHRPPILFAISTLLLAARSIYAAPATQRHQYDEKSLEPFRDSLLDVLREGLRTTGLKVSAVKGSVALVEVPGFWAKGEVEDVVRGMNDALINDADPDVRSTVIAGLTSISKLYPSVIESVTLPLLFHNLPDTAPPLSATSLRSRYRSILDSLSHLCLQPALFETLVIRVNTKLDLLSTASRSATDGDIDMSYSESRECGVAYAWDLLNCLAGVIDAKFGAKHVDVVKYFDQILPRLYGLAVRAAAPHFGDVDPLFRDRRLLVLIARVSETLTWELNVERQTKQFAAVYNAFEKGDITGIVQDQGSSKASSSSSSLRTGATPSEQDLICLYSSTVQGLKSDCGVPFTSEVDFLAAKIHWAIHVAFDAFQVRFALDMITAFVNRRESELRDDLEALLDAIWVKGVIDTEQPLEVRHRAVLVHFHVIKALSLLCQPLAYTAVGRITDILKLVSFDPDFVNQAARGFSVLSEGKGKDKARPSHLTAKLLYAQKLWNFTLRKIIQGDLDAKGACFPVGGLDELTTLAGKDRIVYLVAFSSLLPLVPPALCLFDLSTILPLILRSLSLPDPTQRSNVISTLNSVLETQNLAADVDTLIHQNAAAMVENLLRSALPDLTGAMETTGQVRSAALRCLSMFPDVVRHNTLHSQKNAVLRDLGKALDDPLRSVRREAVECRAKWYRYGSAV